MLDTHREPLFSNFGLLSNCYRDGDVWSRASSGALMPYRLTDPRTPLDQAFAFRDILSFTVCLYPRAPSILISEFALSSDKRID